MQDNRELKRARRRKSGRTRTANLKALSSHAYAMGKSAKRTYATIRLSMRKWHFSTLNRAARFYGLTLSATARRVLAFEEAEGHEAKRRLFDYFLSKTKNGTRPTKPKRGTYTAADLWAKSEAPGRALTNLKLTAWNLAEIERTFEEAKLNGALYGRSYSAAFCRLLMFGLSYLEKLIEAYERGQFIGVDPKDREKPARAKRFRTFYEVKRRIIEEGTRSGL